MPGFKPGRIAIDTQQRMTALKPKLNGAQTELVIESKYKIRHLAILIIVRNAPCACGFCKLPCLEPPQAQCHLVKLVALLAGDLVFECVVVEKADLLKRVNILKSKLLLSVRVKPIEVCYEECEAG